MTYLIAAIQFLSAAFAYEVYDPRTGYFYAVRRCAPLSRKPIEVKYVSCTAKDPNQEQSIVGACSNNDPQSCDEASSDTMLSSQSFSNSRARVPSVQVMKLGDPAGFAKQPIPDGLMLRHEAGDIKTRPADKK